jgi:hypothetical protein
LGLSRGFRETEALSSFLLNNFGSTGYLEFKVTIAALAVGVALFFDRRLRTHSDFTHYLYLTASVSLAVITLLPVVNNLILLGWV